MKPLLIALLAASMTFGTNAVLTKNNCPPGLAKKNPPCVPPGQAKKYSQGERLNDYIVLETPGRYGLPPDGYYVRAGNYVYQIDRNTQKVLNLVGAVVDILN